MKVMVVDGGGRGQALGAKLAGEGHDVFMSPGNPGNEEFAHSTGLEPIDISAQRTYAKNNKIDFTVVGADDPLALGIVDAFIEDRLKIFGPTRQQARLEWDRNYTKQQARMLGIPTGAYQSFTDMDEARAYGESIVEWPVFVKDNGLAQGKGAIKCDDFSQYTEALHGKKEVVVETFVEGPEASHHAFCDGKRQLSIPFLLRDHKTIGENDTGSMTGGMGTVGPLPQYSAEAVLKLGEIFVQPVVEKTGFRGQLFSGLKGEIGVEKNLEYNARPGDPETQSFMRLLKSDLLPVLMACAEGTLDEVSLPKWDIGKSVACLVLAAEGYPENPTKGAVIEGIDGAGRHEGVQLLHAGTAKKGTDIVVNGGRVLNLVSSADTLDDALARVHRAAEQIRFGGKKPVVRGDIGKTVLGSI